MNARAKGLTVTLALALCGASQAAISAPASWLWLHPFVWAPVLGVLLRLERGPRILAGWLVGTSANIAIFAWLPETIDRFTNLPTVAAWALLLVFAASFGFYVAVFAWGVRAVRAVSGIWWPLAVPAWFVACEFLNPQIFPYAQGVAWYQASWIFLSASFLGVPWLSFLVLAANAWILCGWENRAGLRTSQFVLPTVALVLAIASSLFLAQVRERAIDSAEAAGPPMLTVAIVQSNIDLDADVRLMRKGGKRALAEIHAALSREILREHGGPIDVFVWPEGALRGEPGRYASISALARETGAEVWTGSLLHITAAGAAREFNSAFRVTADGATAGRYDKVLRVPFGEYMPFENVFPFLRSIEGTGRVAAGEGSVLLGEPRAKFAFLICYEAIHLDQVRKAIALGPELLVNITYDAWFGRSRAPHQHLMLAAIPAALYGRPLLRAATTGISAVVDPRGKLVGTTPLFEEAALVVEVPLIVVDSLYARVGDAFAWICVAFSALAVGRARLVR